MSDLLTGMTGITGGGGHLGQALCRHLRQAGRRVRVLSRRPLSELEALGVEIVAGDLCDPAALAAFTTGCAAVIHCAAKISIQGDPDGSVWQTNVEGSRLVARACINAKVARLVQVSSVHAVEERPLDQPHDESRPYKKHRAPVYDRSKAEAEKAVLELARGKPLQVVIVRPSALVGPWDFKPSKLGGAIKQLYQGRYPALVAGGYDFVDVRDAAAGCIAALDLAPAGSIYTLSGTWLSLAELARLVVEAGGQPRYRPVLPGCLVYPALPFIALKAKIKAREPVFTKEMIDTLAFGHRQMSHHKAETELGYQPRPAHQTIRDYLAWLKEWEAQ